MTEAGTWRRWAPWLLLAALVAGVAAGNAATHVARVSDRSMTLDDVYAWLLSPRIGETELVDGNTGQVVTRVRLGAGQLSAAQAGMNDFVADSATGTVRRIDGATYEVAKRVSFGQPGEPLAVYPARGALLTVNRTTGVVTAADPATLTTRATYSLAAKVAAGGIVTDGADGLWAIDAPTGDLERVGTAGTTIHRRAVDPAHTQLVTAAGRAVAVDLTARRAFAFDAAGRPAASACVDAAAGDDTVASVGSSGASQVYVTSGQRGVLLISDLATGRCGEIVRLDSAGHRLGQPSEAGGRVFVPDFTTGRVLVVDVGTLRVIASPAVLPAGTPFELRSKGSTMFFNDPASAQAGVINLDGGVRRLQKYDPATVGPSPGATSGQPTAAPTAEAPSSPEPSSPEPSEPETGNPGLSNPGRNNPGPEPGKPGSGQPETGKPVNPAPPAPGAQLPGQGQPSPQPPAPAAPGVRIVISAPQAKAGAPLTLQAVVVDANGQASTAQIEAVAWAFGDNATAAGVQVTHAWAAAGSYPVSATVTTATSGSTTATTTITVTAQSPPTAALQLSTPAGKAPLAVTADGSASRAGGAPIATYRFDFGNGAAAAPAAAPTAGHTYTQPGTYTVTMTVTDTAGNVAVATAAVDVQGAAPVETTGPTAQLAARTSAAAAPADIVADASGSTAGSNPITTYTFSFSDGTTVGPQASPTAQHSVTAAGTYTVTVTVTDAAGRAATANTSVQLTAPAANPPRAALTVEGARSGDPNTATTKQLDASASVAGSSPITSYVFNFGDGATTGSQTASTTPYHSYNPGTYTASVTVTAQDGQQSTATAVVDVSQVAHLAISKTVNAVSPGGTAFNVTITNDAGGTVHVTSISGATDGRCATASLVPTGSCTFLGYYGGGDPPVISVYSDARNSPTSIDLRT